jgi:hypothetical protein
MSEFFPTPDSCDAPSLSQSPLSLTIEAETITDICRQYRVSYTSIIDEWGREFYQFQDIDGNTMLMIIFSVKKDKLLMNLNGVILPAVDVSDLTMCTKTKEGVLITGASGKSYTIPNATVSLVMMALTVISS